MPGHPEDQRRIFLTVFVSTVFVILYTGIVCHFLQKAEETRPRKIVVFEDKDLKGPIAVFPQDRIASLHDRQRAWQGFRPGAGVYLPIVRWGHIYTLENRDETSCYVAPKFAFETATMIGSSQSKGFRITAFVTGLIAFSIGVYTVFSSRLQFWKYPVALGLIRIASLGWTFAIFGFFTIHASDESHYFNIARKMLDPSLSFAEYPYSIGNPLLYLPLLSGMQNLSEFAFIGLQGFVNFCVFGLGVIALTVWTIWRILKKPKTAIIAGLLLCLYPWFIRIYHGPTEKYDILSHFGLWLAHPVDINFMGFYYYTDFVGFNAMSDMPALFFGLLGLVLLHRRLQNEKSLLLPALLLGFSCTVRIANVFYLIPTLFLCLNFHRSMDRQKVGSLVIGLLLAVSPQFIWNFFIFGDPFFFGYKLRPSDYRGFEFENMANGMALYGSAFQQLLLASGLTFFKCGRKSRFACTYLAILIAPTFWFYSGYHAIGQNPVRFIILPLTMMIASVALLITDSRKNTIDRALSSLALVVLIVMVPGERFSIFLIEISQWGPTVIYFCLAGVSAKLTNHLTFPLFFVTAGIGIPQLSYLYFSAACVWIFVRASLRLIASRQLIFSPHSGHIAESNVSA